MAIESTAGNIYFTLKKDASKVSQKYFIPLKILKQTKKLENLFWSKDIAYNKRTVNMIEHEEIKGKKSSKFTFITDNIFNSLNINFISVGS